MTVKLRGHHLLCMLTNEGIGYTDAFAENFDLILARLSLCEDIEIVNGPDDVCTPLVNDKSGIEIHCHYRRVLKRDKMALEAVGKILDHTLTSGSIIDLTESIVEKLRDGFREGTTRKACFKCPWFDKCTEVAESGFVGVRLSLTKPLPTQGR